MDSSLLPSNARFALLVLVIAMITTACTRDKALDKAFVAAPGGDSLQSWMPGQLFNDRLKTAGQYGPEMVVLPAGSFNLGAVKKDKNALAREQPAHQVSFQHPFAISRTEITVAQFAQFVSHSRYRTLAEQLGSSDVFDLAIGKLIAGKGVDWRHDQSGRPARGDFPVMHVAFADAKAYVAWLSQRSGSRYRLPTEAEWEYALRAGSDSIYPWGDKPKQLAKGNLTGSDDTFPNGRNWRNAIAGYKDGYWAVAPVRQYSAEAFGTFDMLGNVSEWVEDCWHENYRRAPADGQAWVNPGCRQRVVRGSAWLSALDQSRSSFRMPYDADSRNARLGFRVVRER